MPFPRASGWWLVLLLAGATLAVGVSIVVGSAVLPLTPTCALRCENRTRRATPQYHCRCDRPPDFPPRAPPRGGPMAAAAGVLGTLARR